jgi:methionine biosynthesis protein MetW
VNVNQLRALLERTWEAKAADAVTGPYRRGSNLRVEAAARWLTDGRRLLDLGCGAGVLAEVIKDRYVEIHGLDLSARAVAAAVERGVQARVWDLNESPLPYQDAYFDSVVSLSVIQYVMDPEAFLREAMRVVRPGGQLCVGSPNLRAFWRLVQLAARGRFPRVSRDPGYDGGTIHYFCARDIEALLIGGGLSIVSSVGAFAWPRWLEGRGDSLAVLRTVKREFLSGEVLVIARKAAK